MSKKKKEAPVEKYALFYRVLKGSKPIPLKTGVQAVPGNMFRAKDILCYPQQLDTILAADPARIKAVENE